MVRVGWPPARLIPRLNLSSTRMASSRRGTVAWASLRCFLRMATISSRFGMPTSLSHGSWCKRCGHCDQHLRIAERHYLEIECELVTGDSHALQSFNGFEFKLPSIPAYSLTSFCMGGIVASMLKAQLVLTLIVVGLPVGSAAQSGSAGLKAPQQKLVLS